MHVWCGVICKRPSANWVFLIVQMSITPFVSFVDGASRSTQNLSSAAWLIYNPVGELIDLQGSCLGCTTNNVAEHSAVIELLTKATALNIRALIVNLDSKLVVLQLNWHYSVGNPEILRLYLRVHLLERHFDYITYQHMPRRMLIVTASAQL